MICYSYVLFLYFVLGLSVVWVLWDVLVGLVVLLFSFLPLVVWFADVC